MYFNFNFISIFSLITASRGVRSWAQEALGSLFNNVELYIFHVAFPVQVDRSHDLEVLVKADFVRSFKLTGQFLHLIGILVFV
jgi:hypothetical protein